MDTIRLFRENVYLREAQARVTSVSEKNGRALITLDRTIFFPTGGGQSCDRGTIAGYEVRDVFEKNENIYHLVNCRPEDLSEGRLVEMMIDWKHRFDNMQRHCGEHILSGIFFREYGGVNRGFHMGDDYMTIDISLEADPSFTEITWEMAEHAELLANMVIWQNLPVITRHFDTKKDAEGLPLRKALAIEKDISIVCVGSVDDPADCVACCGTHPSTAGQVGIIKIYKVESNKGMFRIFFEAGRRALLHCRKLQNTLTALGSSLSAGEDDILAKYKAQQEKNSRARTQLHFLKKEIIRREAENLLALIASGDGYALPVKRYRLLSADDLAAICREISPSVKKAAFLVHEPDKTVFICSDGTVDCGLLVRENASIYGGKGGGNKTLARAIFAKDEYIETFMDLIEKHLR